MSAKKSKLSSTREKKKIVLKALEKTLGNVSAACDAADISRQTFYRWLENDKAFRKKYDALDYAERLLDVAENRLYAKVKEGDLRAVLYLLSTKGAKRGWGKTQKVDVNANAAIVIQDVDKGFFTDETIERKVVK